MARVGASNCDEVAMSSAQRLVQDEVAVPEPHRAPLAAVGELVVSPDGRIVECGPAAAQLLGLADQHEACGVHLSLFCRDAGRLAEALGAAAVTGRLERWDADLLRLDGEPLAAVVDLVASFDEPRRVSSLRVSIKPLQAWAAAEGERSERGRRVDEAGEIAHELNNLLAIISGHAEALGTAAAPARGPSLDAIQSAVASAAKLSPRVKSLGRASTPLTAGVDIDGLLAAVQADVRRTFGHRLSVVVQPAPHPWTVAIERTIVEHALAVVAADAIEAMPHGGALTFRTMNVEVGARRASSPVPLRPGRYVRVEVSYLTSGVPVPPVPLRRETDDVEPAGLAALCRAGGRVFFDTDGVRVASVVVMLPSDGVTVLRPRGARAHAACAASVLLVERDPVLRRLLQTVLEGEGHRVSVSGTPAECREVLARESVGLLVTDAIDAHGADAAGAWLHNFPSLRILATSSEAEAALQAERPGRRVGSVARPLAADQLVDAARQILEAEDAGDVLPSRNVVQMSPRALKFDDGPPIHPLEAS